MTTSRPRCLAGLLPALALILVSGCKEPDSGKPVAIGDGPLNGAPPVSGSPSGGGFHTARKPDGPIKLKLITNGISPFWDPMGKGMDAMRAELGIESSWQGPNPSDNNTQKQVFEDALVAGVDGIGVSPIQADVFASVIDAAIDKGVPVITFDSDSETSKRLVYIGTNNREAGMRAGEEAVKLMPTGGKFVAFVGNMSAQNARDRFEGFMEAVKGHNIEMLQAPYEDNKDVGRARANVADAITKYGDKINGFLGLYSYNPPAIVDEVMKSGIRAKVKIIGFDGEPKTQKALEQGLIDATVVQKPFEFGRLSTKLLYLINRKGLQGALDEMKPDLEKEGMKVEGNKIDTGVKVITPKNAPEFLKWMRDNGLTST